MHECEPMADGLLPLCQRGLLLLCLWCVVQNCVGLGRRGTSSQNAIARLQGKTCAGSPVDQDGLVRTTAFLVFVVTLVWAHGVVVSHPLRMRKALGSNPSVSIANITSLAAGSRERRRRLPSAAMKLMRRPRMEWGGWRACVRASHPKSSWWDSSPRRSE